MVSCAAVKYPRLTTYQDYRDERDRERMQTKIAAILGAVAHSKCDIAVLGAFGCGAFRNPPHVVARIFRDELDRSSLKMVVFCILGSPQHVHNPRGNFLPFK